MGHTRSKELQHPMDTSKGSKRKFTGRRATTLKLPATTVPSKKGHKDPWSRSEGAEK